MHLESRLLSRLSLVLGRVSCTVAALCLLLCGLASTASGQETTTTWLGVNQNPVALGDEFIISSSVMTEGAWPEGTVSFWDGSLLLAETGFDEGGSCGVLIDPGGGIGSRFCSRHASLTMSTLAAGTHPLTASYSGDSATLPSTSDPVVLTVLQPPAQVPALSPAMTLILALLLGLAGCALLQHQRQSP